MNADDKLGWPVLEPPTGGLARMQARIAAMTPHDGLPWSGPMLSFSLSLLVSLLLIGPWQRTAQTERVLRALIDQPKAAVQVDGGIAIEQLIAADNTRMYWLLSKPGPLPDQIEPKQH